MRSIVLSATSAAFLAAMAGSGLAQTGAPLTVIGQRDAENDIVVRVPYGDLLLIELGQRAILDARVKAASHKVCDQVYPRFYSSQKWNCFDAAVRGAQPQIDRAVADADRFLVAKAATITLAFAIR